MYAHIVKIHPSLEVSSGDVTTSKSHSIRLMYVTSYIFKSTKPNSYLHVDGLFFQMDGIYLSAYPEDFVNTANYRFG